MTIETYRRRKDRLKQRTLRQLEGRQDQTSEQIYKPIRRRRPDKSTSDNPTITTPVERTIEDNEDEKLYDYNRWIEKACRKAINRAWARRSKKFYGEVVDPETDPGIRKHFEKIKVAVIKRKKQKVKIALTEQAKRIEKELPNLPKWILQDGQINDHLKNTKFLQVIDCTRDRKVEQDREWSIKWTNKLRVQRYSFNRDGREIECDYVVVRIDNNRLAKYLGMSERSTRKYLQALCKAEILIDLGKPGKNKPKLYASGYWSSFHGEERSGWQRIYFLKQTDTWKEILCRLSLQF